jgi:hypothetical protein
MARTDLKTDGSAFCIFWSVCPLADPVFQLDFHAMMDMMNGIEGGIKQLK